MSPENDYLSAIFMFGGNFTPPNYMRCTGSLLAIVEFTALYATISDCYGGDGRSSMGLPDYRSRVMIGEGAGPNLDPLPMGYFRGLEATHIELSDDNLPGHTHSASFNADALNTAVFTTANLSDTTVNGQLKCEFLSGGVVSPVDKYPGVPTNTSIGIWSIAQNGAKMASNLVGGGKIDTLPTSTSFLAGPVRVTTGTAGHGEAFVHATEPPCQVVPFLICVDGLFPPHSSKSQSELMAEVQHDR
ncbi:MAG: tail fiber protein [Leptospirales bacterium]|jgi:microcystin-dependent protein